MRNIIWSFIGIAVVTLAMNFPRQLASVRTGDVVVSFSLARPGFTLHEPVLLLFDVKNSSPQPVQLDLGKDSVENFLVSFSSSSGAGGQALRLHRPGFGFGGSVQVGPDETYQQNLLLNEWIEFKTLGKYQVQVRLAQPVQTRQGDLVPDGFDGPVEILPEEPAQLRNVCALLAERVEKASSYKEAADAAKALSFVQNPVAIPYLERVLYSKRMVELFAVNGLEKIGDSEAARVLIAALARTSSDIAI